MEIFAIALISLVAALAAPADAQAPGTASGKFADQKWTLDISGAYAFRDKSAGTDDPVIRVAISNTGFVPDAFDEHYDRGHAINTLFVDDETKVVYFEFDESGKYHGLSYYFESGDGCGFCFDSKVKSSVKAAGGRLKGDLSYDGDDRQFQLTLDVPIPAKVWGDALPKDGGAPGKAYLAYHAALEKRDKKAIFALLDADRKSSFTKYEKEDKLDGYLEYRWREEHVEMTAVTITGGFIRGDHAVVLFDGKNAYIDAMHGEAVLRREGGAWLVHRDLVSIGAR
ncbi:MAG: hypothetical protein ABI968_07255 [Acidobacteriota bacterium]